MRTKDGDAIDLARKQVGGRACAGDVGRAGNGEAAIGTLGTPQAKVRHGVSLCRTHHARDLGCHEGLEVHEVEQGRLDELTVDERALDANHGLAREDHVTLGNGVDREVKVVVAEVLKEGRLEHGAAAGSRDAGQVVNVLVVKDEVLHQLGNLPHTAGNRVAAAKGVLAEEGIKRRLRVHKARLPKPLGHRELVEVGVERDIGWLGAVRERHGDTSSCVDAPAARPRPAPGACLLCALPERHGEEPHHRHDNYDGDDDLLALGHAQVIVVGLHELAALLACLGNATLLSGLLLAGGLLRLQALELSALASRRLGLLAGGLLGTKLLEL